MGALALAFHINCGRGDSTATAANAALNSFNKVLLANHIKSCVVENVRNGDDSIIDELVVTIQKLMR